MSLELTHWTPRPPRDPRSAIERRRERDREAKRARYQNDPAYRQARVDRERVRYAADPEKKRAKLRVENMTAAQRQRQRDRWAARYGRERKKRLRYIDKYRWKNRHKLKARRREIYRAKVILRAALDWLDHHHQRPVTPPLR